ncbi:hypothetical protein N7493_007242 [Penicillium malachiteum]|uniref:Uncharacterized protein n=1 Tax=Penicillium malachiteum TaxID=1324776 RepID=A0AAD6MUV0_9EURO|nr:hypothetical protein N7493_007242 [Penicillium malachiteum]
MATSQHRKDGSPSNPPSSSTSHKNRPGKKQKKLLDSNMSNPRLLLNRPCIYERRLPGNAYITAHIQRLQHGYYSSTTMSDVDARHVDFLAISFVFHATNTQTHRFKSATIRVSIHGEKQRSSSSRSKSDKSQPANPRFLMHAPHLIFGAVSPETMQWTFSIAGSLGISETPVSASVIPSGSLNKQFRRYEMMRIQGSSRTLKSSRGPRYDVEAGEIFWSLEENNLQRSGLPREFTFVMLIQKQHANNELKFKLDIDPVLQSWYGSYPNLMLSLPSYQPLVRREVDFQQEIGQKFAPIENPDRGFNFAALENTFDDYISMPGRSFTRTVEIPPENQNQNFNQGQGQMPQTNIGLGYQGQYGNSTRQYGGAYGNGQYHNGYNVLNPIQALQNQGFSFNDNFTANLLQSQIRQLGTQLNAAGQVAQPTTQSTTRPQNPAPTPESTRKVQSQPSDSVGSSTILAVNSEGFEEVAEQPWTVARVRRAEDEIQPSMNRSGQGGRAVRQEEGTTRPRVSQSSDRKSGRVEEHQPRVNRSDLERRLEIVTEDMSLGGHGSEPSLM